MSGQDNPFFLRFAHVSLGSGETNVDVLKPGQQSRHGPSYTQSTANKVTESSGMGISVNASKNPGVTIQKNWTKGREAQRGFDESIDYKSISWERLNPGVKVKYQYTKPDALDSQFLVTEDELPHFSVTSTSSIADPETDLIKIRLSSFWTFRVDEDDVVCPTDSRFWTPLLSRRPKESKPRIAPCFTNFVHCVELEVSAEFLGMVKGWKLAPLSTLDLRMD